MESKKVLKNKRELQLKLTGILNKFHEENPGFEVFGVYVTNEKIVSTETGDTQVICTNINCSVHLV